MAEIKSERRCGNTTRQIDEWVQKFFDEGQVNIIDHAHSETNMANTCAISTLKKRLIAEHDLEYGKDFLIKNKILVRLLSDDNRIDSEKIEYRGYIITKLGKGFYFNGIGIPQWSMVTAMIDTLIENQKK